MFYKISIVLFLFIFSSQLYASQTISTPKDYSLNAELSQSSILLGETTQLKLIYRYKNVEDYEIVEPSFANINVKELNSKDYEDEFGYAVEEINYSLTPLQEGSFSLTNMYVQTEIIDGQYRNFDNKSKYTQKFSVKAKPINLIVKKLPKNITAIGHYKLRTTVDKTHVDKGEVVTLTISLYGEGNIQNLDAIVPNIKNATTYLLYTTTSKRQELQTKVYEIISDEPYTIPSFELQYYDKEASLVKNSRSGLINVSINGYVQKKTAFVTTKEKYLFFVLGVLSILLLLYLHKTLTKTRVKKETRFIKVVKSCANKSDLYKKVVVYLRRDKELDSLIYALEGESKRNFKSIKKEIIKRLIKLGLNERDNLLFTTKNTL
ncbi:BatD family protein [Sulfurimonas sp. SAG-AH-194-C21]|nr:hypothetical protein [Sulfurimonas sp. SAG-AH-194-C21]MDF1884546.1 BatD family protein [Sulfurimonas sp. SAG-AH-194-C21]